MNPVPLSDIANMADNLPVMKVEGTVKYASEITRGTSPKGSDWSRQFFVLTDGKTEVGCTLWDADDGSVAKGDHVTFTNVQNKKKQWAAITKSSYEKNGQTNHTLEIRSGQVKWGNNNEGGDTSCPDQTTEIRPAGSNPAPNVQSAGAGVNEARQHIMRAANLHVLCVNAVNSVIAPNVPAIAQTAEFFQAAVASLFIEASSRRTTDGINWWSYVDRMPASPVQKATASTMAQQPTKTEETDNDEVPF